MNIPAITAAIEFATAHEVPWPRDPLADPACWGVHHADPPPWNRLRGPVHARGGVSGVVLQHGREIAAWGDPERADLTFSVAKTYLAVLAGVAHGRGLLPDVDEPVIDRVRGIGFEPEHNRGITWAHLLQQTSEWEGSCFGIPDTVDRWRQVAHDPRPATGRKGDARPLRPPGTYWEYNDVRINQLSLALLHLFGAPLPEVFRDAVMRPLGAGDSWRWVGYDDAWVDVPRRSGGSTRGVDVVSGATRGVRAVSGAMRRVQSVPGGTHWGGGVSIGARDQARIGQLLLGGGRHGDAQLIPTRWVERMREACPIAPFYGWLMWLNRDGRSFPGASADSSFMVGAGGHYVWIEPRHHAVVVVRWIDPEHAPAFIAQMAAAFDAGT